MAASSPALALGLGDIQLRSALGQPLHATIDIIDPLPGADASCFSVDSGAERFAPLPRLRLSLVRTGERAVLHVRTPQSVNDPIMQFVLSSDCQARLRREYVVLLDPPAEAESGVPLVTADAQDTPRIEADSAPNTTPPPRTAPRVAQAKPATARNASRRAPVHTAAANTGTPRLILSGRARGRNPALALKYDLTLPDLTRPRPDDLDPVSLSDENTALNRKLSYLESQLVALHKRNAELDAQLARTRSASSTPIPERAPAQPPQWPFYLLVVGLLASGGLLALWLRNRSRAAPEPEYAPPEPLPASLAHLKMEGSESIAPGPGRSASIVERTDDRLQDAGPPDAAEMTEVKDDILDQAEVYLAHGHSDLAIHMLQEHLRAEPNESPIPWLLLLDLLHRAGDHEGYAAASTECRRYFNINLGSHPPSPPNAEDQGLEAYPHLLEQLVRIWDLPERENFFDGLIHDDRGGTRIGFEQGAYRDILLLRAIALDTEPSFV